LRELSSELRVTLIDRSDGFTFGFAKFDVLLGRRSADEVKLPYRDVPGFRHEEIVSIDPANRFVRTDRGGYTADALVVALGADYVPFDGGYEFYSIAGAERLRDTLPSITKGEIVLGVLGVPFKCPPAPYEGLFLLHDYFVERGVRDDIEMRLVTPMPSPIPVSPGASEAIVAGLDDRGIKHEFGRPVTDEDRAADYFIGVPKHTVAPVVDASGLCADGIDGWAHVDPSNLRTRFDRVWALGDCADVPVPRAGVFAEAEARVVAEDIAGTLTGRFLGRAVCYVEFGRGVVGRVEADFLSGPSPDVPFVEASAEIAKEKAEYARSRRLRWFGKE
jgi:sulfide:quinone oxidoreductase